MGSGAFGALCCVLPLVAAAAVAGLGAWLWQWASMRDFNTAIEMDGVTCLAAEDGRVLFRRHPFRYSLYLAILGLVLAGLMALVLSTVRDLVGQKTTLAEAWPGLGLEMGAGVLIVAAIVVLVRSLWRPSTFFDASAGVLRVGRGRGARQIPFADISYVDAGLALAPDFGGHEPGIYDIDLVLKNGARLTLGTVSGKDVRASERANQVAHLVAQTTGAPLRLQPINDELQQS